MQYLMMFLLFAVAVLLILLILVQRGKGGGLAGALGGMGGQSAFGTKAGDTFTRITIGMAALWIILCIASVRLLAPPATQFEGGLGGDKATQTGEEKPDNGGAPSETGAPSESGAPSEPGKSEAPAAPAE